MLIYIINYILLFILFLNGDIITKSKRNNGKYAERKSRKLLDDSGCFVIQFQNQGQGCDIIAFCINDWEYKGKSYERNNNTNTVYKFKKGYIYYIEVKSTIRDRVDINWIKKDNRKQLKEYKKITNMINSCDKFNARTLLFFWKKKNNKWKLEIEEI